MAQIGNKCPGIPEYHDFDSGFCLNGCQKQCVPAPVLVHIENKLRVDKHQGDYVSVTSMLGCMRQLFLGRVIDYYEEPRNNWYSIRGTLIHSILEQPDFGAMIAEMKRYVFKMFERGEISREDMEFRWNYLEEKLQDFYGRLPRVSVIDDWESEIEYEYPLGNINGKMRKLKGTIDVLRRLRGSIIDFKSSGDNGLAVLRKGLKQEHVMQFNIYRLLVERGYPLGESYETYRAPVINEISAYYISLMEIVETGGVMSDTTAWLVAGGTGEENLTEGVRVVGDPQLVGVKEEIKAKKGKRLNSTNPDDFEIKTYNKYKLTYQIPAVPLLDLDEVEKFVHTNAPVLFEAFENGKMPNMCAPEMREWKCDKYCPDQVRQACDAHNMTTGESRVVKPKNVMAPIEILPMVEA